MIEVIGPAGVGKSTFIQKACNGDWIAPGSVAVVKGSSRPRIRDALSGLVWKIEMGIKIYKTLRPVFHKGAADWVNMTKKLMMTGRECKARHNNVDVLILDEVGVFHSLQWFGVRAGREAYLLHSLTNTQWFIKGLPDMLICLESSEETRLIRRRGRGNSADRLFLKDLQLKGRLDRNRSMMLEYIRETAELLDRQGALRFLTINVDSESDGSMHPMCSMISDAIKI